MARYTEEDLIQPIHNILTTRKDGFFTTTEIINLLEDMLSLSTEDKKIVRGTTTRFRRTVHNSVSHRKFHTAPNGKKIVEISPTTSRINVMRLSTYGRKYVKKMNKKSILG